ncbi:N-terminal region of Chorein or VPS13/Vacuolar sorting-associated protein 13, N-terminal, putative, partial [Plasmodium malariae]
MLESLVEKLLNKFLAPYVEGIERNLHLGVWSGNIVLENLKLKPQITEILDLSFKIIHGNIGRVNIQIPWSSLGKSPVCVLIKNVHIYIKPRSYQKSESVIIEELRRAKMHRLELLEEEISIIKQQKNKEKSSEKSTLIFKLLNKIINNIHIDIQDILIHFEDPGKKFSIGFILKSSSVKNCQKNVEVSTEANTSSEYKKLNHIIEFKGLCIYSNSNIRKRRRKKKKEY